MRTQFIVTTFLLIFKLINLNGQPTELFWGGTQTDFACKIIKLSDGNLMTAGTKRIGQKYQINLTKHNDTGAIIWEMTYPSEDWETANFIASTSDGGFIIAGAWYDFPQDTNLHEASLLVVKIDSMGNIAWKTSLSDRSPGYCALETPNHEFLIGTVDDPPGISEKAAILRLSSTGSLTWSKNYSFKETSRLKQIFPSPDGGYFIAGRARNVGASFSGVFFAKVAENGSLIWSKYEDAGYFGEGDGLWSSPMGALQLLDSTVIIAYAGGAGGFYNFQTSVLKYSTSGDLLWKRIYNNAPDESNIAYDLQLCPDGRSLLISGESGPNLGPKKGFAMMVDTAGYEYWRETYGSSGNNHLFSAICLNDSSLVFVGTSTRSGNGGYDQWFLKTDYDGNIVPFTIGGEVWIDMNGNCSIDSIDMPAKNWLITVDDQKFLFTDANGHYEIKVNAGNYLLKLITQASFWSVCSNDITVSVDSLAPILSQNFLVKPEQTCPIVELGITTPDLIRCDTSVVFATWPMQVF
ncbi:MAG: hypothetical protein IPM82_10085 [Saprospiraceae bacterium]|nr:hypothetical protein [Saprospiraceae bacterium]